MIPGELVVSLENACFWSEYDPRLHNLTGIPPSLVERRRRLVLVLQRIDGSDEQPWRVFYRVLVDGGVAYVKEHRFVDRFVT